MQASLTPIKLLGTQILFRSYFCPVVFSHFTASTGWLPLYKFSRGFKNFDTSPKLPGPSNYVGGPGYVLLLTLLWLNVFNVLRFLQLFIACTSYTVNTYGSYATSLTSTGTHVPYVITQQCYRPPDRDDIIDIHTFTPPSQLKLVLDSVTQERCKAELS